MPRALLISVAGAGVILLLCVLVWLYLRRKRKAEAGIALGAVTLLVTATVPLIAKPVEDAWSPVTSGTPSTSASQSPVPPPDATGQRLRSGWGPERELFTTAEPPGFVTLNSITDNPHVGDERTFLVVRHTGPDCGSGPPSWGFHEKVTQGDHLMFRVYVENSAADNLDIDGSHTVRGLRLKVTLPDRIGDPSTGSAGQAEVSATLKADNTEPREYWHIALLSADRPLTPELMSGTSKLHTDHFGADGLALPDSFLHDPGMLLGYDKLDGNLRAGHKYALYLTFCVRFEGYYRV
ncbi:hypothetical protein GCM10010492_38470 [Saccharothrix mutabilis subsp. mutabilis]|uniref:Uncharacterized protein n=1 Tax=Saccharothrix mutabilis subsp. mutabilis TaxID=66855 RepID=A0ABN0U1T3_9PSEU